MSKYSDFPNNRINIVEMLECTTFDTDVNRALIENTFNRFLTKDQNVKVDALVGKPNPIDPVNRQIKENDPHRQAFQLQPIINYQSGVETVAYSFKDVTSLLEKMGVRLDEMDKWGQTEQFNFMPPVTLDKLVNYRDYYWYDAANVTSVPQYVVMATFCSTANSRVKQAERELQRYPLAAIDLERNAFVIPGDQTAVFSNDMEFDINGAHNVGVYRIASVFAHENGNTYIVPTVKLTNSNYGDSYVSFNTTIAKLHNERNRVCDGTIGWDSYGWDDKTGAEYYPITLGALAVDNPDLYEVVKRVSPESFDDTGIPVDVEARFIWEWMKQPVPEFTAGWDGTGEVINLNPWQEDNKWVHKLDLPQGALAFAKQASAPIIEYTPGLQFNEWSERRHNWWYRAQYHDKWYPTARQPSSDDIQSPDFTDHWIYVDSSDVPVPCDHQSVNLDAVAYDRKSTKTSSWRVFELTSDTVNRRLVIKGRHSDLIAGRYTVFDGDARRVVSVVGIEYDSSSDTTTLRTAGNTLYAQPGQFVGYINALTPNLFTLEDPADQRRTLAGKNQTRVYVNGVQLNTGFREWTSYDQSTNVWYVVGVVLDHPILQYDTFSFSIDPAANVDVGLNVVQVRTPEYADNIVYEKAGKPLSTVTLVKFNRLVQHKAIGEHKVPMFDMYTPTGVHSGRVSPIFYYVLDSKAPTHKAVKQRLKVTKGADDVYYFKQFLVEYDNGPIYCYKQFSRESNQMVLRSIWRTSLDVPYIPKKVDENGRIEGEQYIVDGKIHTTVLTDQNSDWGIFDQLTYNASHENRVELSVSDLRSHIDSIQRAQPAIPGFKKSRFSFRLNYEIQPHLGGTIKEHNGSFDVLAAAVTAVNALPTEIVDFAEVAYLRALSTLFDNTLNNISTMLLDVEYEAANRFPEFVSNLSIEQHELNDVNETVFGDSGSYSDGMGVKAWPATLPLMGWGEPIRPLFVEDQTLNIRELIHHDGHRETYNVPVDKISNILNQTIRTTIVDPWTNMTRRRGRSANMVAREGEPLFTHFSEIPGELLVSGDLWQDENTVYRLNAHVTRSRAPNVEARDGEKWFNKSANQMFIRANNEWVQFGNPGEHASSWGVVDVQSLIDQTLLTVETRLFEVAQHVKQNDRKFIRDGLDFSDSINRVQQNMFKQYMVNRGLTESTSFVNHFNISNPFTWNYSKFDLSAPYAWQPAPNVEHVPGFWKGSYTKIYGTAYPHLEPWVVQGYQSKPDWWDSVYADETGTRRWTPIMWENVVSNRIPAQYETPRGTSFDMVFDATSGIAYKQMQQRVFSVPVNVDAPIVNTKGDVVYELDALFPPYDSRIVTPSNPHITESAIGRPWIVSVPSHLSESINDRFMLGDGAQIEYMYHNSTVSKYNNLKQALVVDPIHAFSEMWGEEYVTVDGLKIAKSTNSVLSHKNMRLHGDYDRDTNTLFHVRGLNQWYINYIRDSSQDLKTANVRLKLNTWGVKLGYAAAGFISPKTTHVTTDAYDLSPREFKVIPKRTLAVNRYDLNALGVAVSQYGKFRKRNGARVPYDDASDWKFTLFPLGTSQQEVKRYDVDRYQYRVADADNGILVMDHLVPWNTGERVYIETSKYSPYPLDPIWSYFIEVLEDGKHFKLHKQASAAYNGEPTVIRTEGEGVQWIGKVQNTFDTLVHTNKVTTWKHHTLNKTRVLVERFPVEVTGVQGIIDFVDGYSEYLADQGIIANHDEARSADPWTGRVISWFTETESAIIRLYEGRADLDGSSSNVSGFKPVNFSNGEFSSTSPHHLRTGSAIRFYSTTAPSNLPLTKQYFVVVTSPTAFKVASSERNAIDGLSIEVDDWSATDITIGTIENPHLTTTSALVINPFKQDVWVKTPIGMVSDLSAVGSTSRVYDLNQRPIEPSRLSVYRQDKLTRICVRGAVDGESEIGGARIQIDGFEHVILLDHYTADGYVMYDPFIGVKLSRINVKFVRGIDHNMRPGLGGYYVDGVDLRRNIEGAVTDMRSYYDNTNDQAIHGHAQSGRELLGFDDAPYLTHLNADDVTKFTFWKGSLRYKGASKGVKALINHTKFVDASLDEYWAFKLADFGDIRPRRQFKVKMSQRDTSTGDLRYTFRNWKRNSAELVEGLGPNLDIFSTKVTQTTSLVFDGLAQRALVESLRWIQVDWLVADGLVSNADILTLNVESYEKAAVDGLIPMVDVWNAIRHQTSFTAIDGWLSTVNIEESYMQRATHDSYDGITPSVAIERVRTGASLYDSKDAIKPTIQINRTRYNEPDLTVVGGLDVAPYLYVATKTGSLNSFTQLDVATSFDNVPQSTAIGVSFNHTGDYLAVRLAEAPHLVVYYRDGLNYTTVYTGEDLHLSDVSAPTSLDRLQTWVEFSRNGEYLYINNGPMLKHNLLTGEFTVTSVTIDRLVGAAGPVVITASVDNKQLFMVTHDEVQITSSVVLNTHGTNIANPTINDVVMSNDGQTLVVEVDGSLMIYKWREVEYVLVQLLASNIQYSGDTVTYRTSRTDVAINRDGSRLYATVNTYAASSGSTTSQVTLYEYDGGSNYNVVGGVGMVYLDGDGFPVSAIRPSLNDAVMSPGDDVIGMGGRFGISTHSISENGLTLTASEQTTDGETYGRVYAITWCDERTYIKRPVNVTTSNPVQS